jgi:hypothetical protein
MGFIGVLLFIFVIFIVALYVVKRFRKVTFMETLLMFLSISAAMTVYLLNVIAEYVVHIKVFLDLVNRGIIKLH